MQWLVVDAGVNLLVLFTRGPRFCPNLTAACYTAVGNGTDAAYPTYNGHLPQLVALMLNFRKHQFISQFYFINQWRTYILNAKW